jgi:two-component system, OmpR family, phosphate regulon response regulator OmpR
VATAGPEARLLIVDDEPSIVELLSASLRYAGFAVTTATDGAEAMTKARRSQPDLLVLDVMMPGENGLELTESLRQTQTQPVPILLLTARAAPEDRIAGFEAGADDYLGKPFEPRELVLRIRALLRRAPPPPAPEIPVTALRIGAAEFDIERGELRDAAGPVRLTGGEAALLTALARKANEVLSREEIAEALGMDDAGERAIDVQVVRLRRKIEADPREPRFLHTVRGRGYILKPGV